MKPRLSVTCVVALALAVLPAISPVSASAAQATQQVSGTSLGTLAIVAGLPAVFTTGFDAGSTTTTTGLLTLTDTDPSWSLAVQDESATDPGHMRAAAIGCSGSESALQNPLSVDVTSLLGGAESAGPVSIAGSPQTVSSATGQLLAADVFTASYSQTIEQEETLLTGCVYSLTATYTLQ